MADGGTIFLDEIGELDLACQVKLLRVLQDRTFEVLGDSKPRNVDIRVVCATNRNLQQMVREGTFREDLYHRLSVIEIDVPPLRERQEDIGLLVDHFLTEICTRHEMNIKSIDDDAIDILSHCRWTGNIRELHNVVERLIILSDERITADNVRLYCHA